MSMKTTLAVTLTLASIAGCGGAAADPAEPVPSAPEAPAAAQAAPTTVHLGEWVMEPPPGEERKAALVRYALATPPAVEAFEATRPDPREQEFFTNILRMRDEDPGSPILESLQRKLDQLEGVRVTFLPDKFIVTSPGGTDIIGYRVEEDLGNRLVILEEGTKPEANRRQVLSFDGKDRMVITTGPTRIPMVRVADGTLPRPNEVASKPTGAGATSPEHSPDGAVPTSGDAEYDACVEEYYRCIDRMPAAERDAMADTLAYTKKIFTDAQGDPERMRAAHESCKQAVALAHSTFCR